MALLNSREIGPEDVAILLTAAEIIEALFYSKFRVIEDNPNLPREERHFRVDLGRRMGHTTAAGRIYRMLERNNVPAFIVVDGQANRRYVVNAMGISDARVIDLRHPYFHDRVLDAFHGCVAIIDGASRMDEEDRCTLSNILDVKMWVWLQ